MMNRIKEIREKANLTQEALAELVGTTGNTISRLELGEQQLTQHWMEVLSDKLDCNPADFISRLAIAVGR
jgi:transcriptional regulator with XRE-family HTH domain